MYLLISFSPVLKSFKTCYRLDGPGIEFQWRRDFQYLSRSALGPTEPLVQGIRGLLPAGTAAGVWP